MIGEFMQAVYRELAPGGAMRAAIHYGNATIAQRDAPSGQPRGRAVDLADELARRLGVTRRLLSYEGAGQTFEAGLRGDWEIAFLAIDPVRQQGLDFTIPYLVLEGTFLVRQGAPFRSLLDLDLEGMEIAVVEGSFHDLHLTRRLRLARLRRSKAMTEAIAQLVAGHLHAVAGLKPALAAVAAGNDGLRVIEGRYAAVQQAIAIPKGRHAALRYLNSFVEEVRANAQAGGSG